MNSSYLVVEIDEKSESELSVQVLSCRQTLYSYPSTDVYFFDSKIQYQFESISTWETVLVDDL